MSNDDVQFIALGRYTAAADKAGQINRERYAALMELKRLINGDFAPEDIKRIDFARAAELLEVARVADGQLRQAFEDANAVADQVKKPRLDYRR